MIIYVKQACEFVSKDGSRYHCANGFIGCPPEWVANDPYFKALAQDGKITVHMDNKGAEVEAEKTEAGKRKKS